MSLVFVPLNFIFITNAFVVYALYAVTVAELKARQPNQKVLPLLNYFHSCSYCRCSHCVFRFLFVFSLLFHWPRSFLLFAVPLILFCFALQITFFCSTCEHFNISTFSLRLAGWSAQIYAHTLLGAFIHAFPALSSIVPHSVLAENPGNAPNAVDFTIHA